VCCCVVDKKKASIDCLLFLVGWKIKKSKQAFFCLLAFSG